MSNVKRISSYTSTGRNFGVNHNLIQNTKGVILHKKDWTFTDADLEDENFFFNAFEAGDLLPLHWVQDVEKNSTPIGISDTPQKNTVQTSKGVIRHVLKFEWDLAYHQIVNTYSGSDLNILYYDSDRHLIYTEESTGVYRGFKTSRILLEDFDFTSNGTEPILSKLDIELYDSLEINEKGYSTQLDWLPSDIDKLFLQITITSIGVDYINFTAKYLSTDIDNIVASDITITDNFNGNITGVLLSYSSGVYQASNFSSNISQGCLTVNAAAYLGKKQYRVTTSISVVVSFDLMNGDSFDLMSGVGFDLMNVN